MLSAGSAGILTPVRASKRLKRSPIFPFTTGEEATAGTSRKATALGATRKAGKRNNRIRGSWGQQPSQSLDI